MKQLMRDLFVSWQSWVFVGSICMVVIGITMVMLWGQRRDEESRKDQVVRCERR